MNSPVQFWGRGTNAVVKSGGTKVKEIVSSPEEGSIFRDSGGGVGSSKNFPDEVTKSEVQKVQFQNSRWRR